MPRFAFSTVVFSILCIPFAAAADPVRPATVELNGTLTTGTLAGTPLELVLRGCDVDAVAVVGVATEIGIEPTVRHAGDLGFVPVVITDACGAGDAVAGARAIETLKFLGEALLTNVEGFRAAVAGAK